MVDQHIRNDFRIRFGVLFRQCQKREDNDDLLFPVLQAMAQRKVQQRQRFSGVSVGLLAIICDRVQLRLYHIVGDETVVVPIDCLYYRAAAGTSLIAAFQKAGAAYCMVNTRPRAL